MNYLLPKKGMPGMKQFWKRGDWSFRKQEKSREKEKKVRWWGGRDMAILL